MNEPIQGQIVPQPAVAQPAQQPPVQPAQPIAPQVTPAAEQPATSDRTREQFEKLLESNKRLYEANEQLRQEMVQRQQIQRQPAQTPPQPVTPQQVDPRDFVEYDPVTGEAYLNQGKMQARIQEIEERAARAEQSIQSFIKTAEQREFERQTNETFAAYPELNPEATTFDAGFHKQVRGVLTDSMFNPTEYGGRTLTFREAADLVRGFAKPAQQTPQGGNNPTGESVAPAGATQKEQASAQAMSQPQNAPSQTYSEDLEVLRMQTRLGSDDALARRLVATDHTFKSE